MIDWWLQKLQNLGRRREREKKNTIEEESQGLQEERKEASCCWIE